MHVDVFNQEITDLGATRSEVDGEDKVVYSAEQKETGVLPPGTCGE